MSTEPSVNVAGQRGRPPKKVAEQHRKEARLAAKKPVVPAMKSGQATRARTVSEEFEEEPELMQYQAIVDMQDEVANEAQRGFQHESVSKTPDWSQSTRKEALEERDVIPAPNSTRKSQALAIPTSESLAELARNTSPAVIVKAMLSQEVRGIRQVDLLGTPELATALSKVIEDARKPKVRFQDLERPSGESMAVTAAQGEGETLSEAVQQLYDWGTESDSGETFAIGSDHDNCDVITTKMLQNLSPLIARCQRERRGAEANEVQDFQQYSVKDEEDRYVEEQSGIPTAARVRAGKRAAIKSSRVRNQCREGIGVG